MRALAVALLAAVLCAGFAGSIALAADPPIATSVALSAGPNPSIEGDRVDFVAQVNSATGAPVTEGTVTFHDGALDIVRPLSDPFVRPGYFTYTQWFIGTGDHVVTADFTGTSRFAPSSASMTQVVMPLVTATTVVSSRNPSVFGDVVTVTASVTSGEHARFGGRIRFSVDGQDRGSVVNLTGTANLTLASLSTGDHVVTVTYDPTGGLTTGMSSASLTQTVRRASTSVTLSGNATSVLGQVVTFTARVLTSNGTTPYGRLSLFEGSTLLSGPTWIVAGGAVDFTVGWLGVGSHDLVATFQGASASVPGGPSDFEASASGVLTHTVTKAPTAVTAAATAVHAFYGFPVRFTATVRTGGQPVVGANVVFREGTTVLAGPIATDAYGQSWFDIATLPGGSHTITAAYGGSDRYEASSADVTYTVDRLFQSIFIRSIPPWVIYGAPPITVSAGSYAGLPVTLNADGACMLNGATLTFNVVGVCTLVATQPGDETYLPAADVTGTIEIRPARLDVWAYSQILPYGSANLPFSGRVDGAVNGDAFTLTFSCDVTPSTAIGDYPIVPTPHGPALGNYTVVSHDGTRQVFRASLTVRATDVVRPYGEPNPPLTGTVTGLVNGETVDVTYTTTATQFSTAAGGWWPNNVHPIVPTVTGAALANYMLQVFSGELTITLAPQTVTFEPLPDRNEGDPNFDVSASSSSGLPVTFSADGACTVSGSAVHLVGSGLCTITARQGGGENYLPASLSRSFRVISIAERIARLRAVVASLGLPSGAATGLDATLAAGHAAVLSGHNACGPLLAFQHQVEAQDGRALTHGQADVLLVEARSIQSALAC